MESFSLIDVMLNRPPNSPFGDMDFSIVQSWFVLIYSWLAMVVAYWFTSVRDRWGLRNYYPILANILLVGTHALWCRQMLTTKLAGPDDVQHMFAPFTLMLWPLSFLCIGLFAWHLLSLVWRKQNKCSVIISVICYAVLSYTLGSRAWHGYVTYFGVMAQMSQLASNKAIPADES